MSLSKAYLEPERGENILCLFNPSELSVSKSSTWETKGVAGRDTPRSTYDRGGSGSLSLNLTLDTTDDGTPVTKHTDKLMNLLQVDPELPDFDKKKNTGRPPWVIFHWGDFHSFKSVVTSLNLSFTYFSSTGTPLRAKAALTLQQLGPDPDYGPQNPTSGTPYPHRLHTVSPGETLDRIAATYYGNAGRWRALADANGIEDPLAIRPGTVITIPDTKELDA